MANLTEFISAISTNIGLANADSIKLILSSPELTKIELPDEFMSGFNTKYLTEDSAKANVNVKNHFTSTALNPIDTSLKSLMDEMEFTPEDKDEINKIKSTYAKNEAVIKKMKAMSSKSTSEEDKVKFNKEITRLNGELVKKDADKETSIRELNNGWVSKLSNSTLTSKIISQPLYTTDTLDVHDVTTLAHNKLEKALQEKKVLKVFDPETLSFKLVQKDSPELAYFDGGKEVTFDNFLQKTLADAKLLKTTTTATTATTRTAVQTRTDADNKDKTPLQKRIANSVEDDLANLQAANA